jgi:spore germination cell wall hydrolase CwlJ-like protein
MRPLIAALAALLALPAAGEEPSQPSEDELECVAEAVYHEARGTSEASQEAVAHVVVNRAEDEDFPDDVCAVVEDRCQFSYECDGKSEAMTEPEERTEAVEAAQEVLEGEAPDPTGGALYYHNDTVIPDWAEDFQPTRKLGGHTFYR